MVRDAALSHRGDRHRVGSDETSTTIPRELPMLEDHGAVLSHLFAQPFTSSFLDAVLEHDYETHRHLLNVGTLCARVARDRRAIRATKRWCSVKPGSSTTSGSSTFARRCSMRAHDFSEAEWRILRAHAARGEQMLHAHGAHAIARDRARPSRTARRLGLSRRPARARDPVGDAAALGRRRVRRDALGPPVRRRDLARRRARPAGRRATCCSTPTRSHALVATLGAHAPPPRKAVAPIS